MKAFIKISKIAFILAFLVGITTGCKDTAELSVDPEGIYMPFTFEPSHGYPGTQVAIDGTGFNSVASVAFGTVEAEIVSKTDNRITVVVPVGAVNSRIKLVYQGGLVVNSGINFLVDESPIPTIIEFTPAVAQSNQQVLITGSLFNRVDSVYIGDLKAEIVEGRTDNELVIITPDGLQTGFIRLFYNRMTSYGIEQVAEARSGIQLSLALPNIADITPDISALNVGDELVITGDMFDQLIKVEFGDIEIDAEDYTVENDGTVLRFLVPELNRAANAANGYTGRISLTVPDGVMESGTFRIVFPTFSGFLPTTVGQAQTTDRFFSVSGSNLDLVTGVRVGGVDGVIDAQTSNTLTFFVSGSAGGFIDLVTDNGFVTSQFPYLLAGDFWVTDYDTDFIPRRLTSEMWDGGNNSTYEVVSSGTDRGNYRRTTTVVTNSPRYYFRADQTDAHPAPDRFLLYTDDSQGVYFEFEISYNELPAGFFDENGEVAIKIFMFSATQNPYGFSIMKHVAFNGPGDWQTVRVYTHEMSVETGSGGLFNAEIPEYNPNNTFSPNDTRIVGIIFGASAGIADFNGELIDVNFDNVKFVIE